MDRLAHDYISWSKYVVGDDAETAVHIVPQPVAGMTAERRDFIGQYDFEGFLHPQRQNMVGQADVAARRTGDGWRDRPVFMQKFTVRDSPMVTTVARQYCVPRKRVHHSFGSTHDTGNIRQAYFHLPSQSCHLELTRHA